MHNNNLIVLGVEFKSRRRFSSRSVAVTHSLDQKRLRNRFRFFLLVENVVLVLVLGVSHLLQLLIKGVFRRIEKSFNAFSRHL